MSDDVVEPAELHQVGPGRSESTESCKLGAVAERHLADVRLGLNLTGVSLLMLVLNPLGSGFFGRFGGTAGFFLAFNVGLVVEHYLWRIGLFRLTRAAGHAGGVAGIRARRVRRATRVNLLVVIVFVALMCVAWGIYSAHLHAAKTPIVRLMMAVVVIALGARVVALRYLPGTAGVVLRHLGKKRAAAILGHLCWLGTVGAVLAGATLVGLGMSGLFEPTDTNMDDFGLVYLSVIFGMPLVIFPMLIGGFVCLRTAGRL